MTTSENFDTELIAAALQVRQRAYARYSQFFVGAALRADARIFVGCNVENASYGLTICAERAAAFAAVAAGCRQFAALAVASAAAASPCGACRQVLAEFAGDLPIFLVDAERPEQVQIVRLAELLPRPFLRPG